MPRDTSKDGFSNKLETFLLTNFGPVWRLVQMVPPVRGVLNRWLIRRAILKTKTRPHQFSLKSDYTSWDSLTDRTFTGRHLPPSSQAFQQSLPPVEQVVDLFRRSEATYRMSKKSTVLFTSFAQWFTDGFLRTSRNDAKKNTSNHEIDLCQIYGLNAKMTRQLREGDGGRLKTSVFEDGNHFPPLYFDANGNEKETEFSEVKPLFPPDLPVERKRHIFVGGVERLNVSLGYAMLNTLFLREHNRICQVLANENPEWKDDDERLFQTARNILIVILLRIVVEDYINHITPYHFKFKASPWDFTREKWYRNNWMTIEFNLLYRWHSMVPEFVLIGPEHVHLADSLFNNHELMKRGLGPMCEDASRQCAAELGLFNTNENLVDAERKSLELARSARLRSYNDYRELFGFPRVTDWSQISGSEVIQKSLKQVYQSVDKIEFIAGLFAEDVRENSALSPLVGRMVGVDAFSQALTNPLLSLHVFNPDTFSPAGWEIIQQTNSLTQLLHRNIGDDTQKYAVNFTQDGDEVPEPKVSDRIAAQQSSTTDAAEERSKAGLESAAMAVDEKANFDESELFIK